MLSPESEIPKRGLTRFLCQELLFDFATGGLDARRTQEVETFLKTCKESQRELEKINRAIQYTASARQLKVRSGLHMALANFEPVWQKRLRELTDSFVQRGWRWLPHTVIALTLVMGLVATKPWQKTVENDLILAEQLKKEPDMLAPASAPLFPTEIAKLNPEPILMVKPENLVMEAPSQPPLAPKGEAAAEKKEIAESSERSETIKTLVSTPPAVLPMPSPVAAPNNEAVARADDKEPPAPGSRGFLMRGELGVSDFHNSWPAIRDKISALGGTVAGNVEMGWLRTPKQSYFHVSIPESNFKEFEVFLWTFGPVEFRKERHARVMPEGQIRIILTVKDSVEDESPAEAP